MRAAPSVVVIVLSWNGREDTLACLRSLAAVTYAPLSIVCVDNGSTDGSADAVAAEYPSVRLERLDRNHGFAGGMNAGIRVALEEGADLVLTLNNDTVVEPGFLEPLVSALSTDPASAAACSQMLFAGDPPRVWYAGASWRPRRGYQGRHVRYGRSPVAREAPPYVTDRACAGAMLAPRPVLERVGMFDEQLFAYGEDVDWSLRAHEVGLHVLVVPTSIVRHRVSAASGGESSPATIYYGVRNMLEVSERHAPLGRLGTWRRRAVLLAAHVAQALLSSQRGPGLRAVRDGWRDFRRRRFGPRPSVS
jgi:GT2 family glycosyltransferase